MAKKKKHLLEEGTASRFMGLAGIGALAPEFITEKYGKYKKDDDMYEGQEEEVDEVKTKEDLVGRNAGEGSRLEEMPMPDDEMPMDDEYPEDEMPMDEPEAGGVDVESLVTALADVIETETGVPVDVEGAGEEMPPDDEMPVGDEYPEDEMMEASEILSKLGYQLDEKTGKYYMEENSESSEQLDENKEENVKEEKDVQEEGDEELDEEAQNLKSTNPNNPGKVKTGSTDRVQGVQKPGPVEHSHADHALKNAPSPSLKTLEGLEKKITASVLKSLKEAVRASKDSKKKNNSRKR